MHSDKQVNIWDIIGIHVKPSKFSICLAKQLYNLHILNYPLPINCRGLKTFIVTLANVMARFKIFHLIKEIETKKTLIKDIDIKIK